MGAPRKPQVVLEGMEDEGGINIEIARQRMQEEDKLDKQRYREMIKKRHKVRDASSCTLPIVGAVCMTKKWPTLDLAGTATALILKGHVRKSQRPQKSLKRTNGYPVCTFICGAKGKERG